MSSERRPLIGITAGEIVNKDDPWSPVTHGQSITFIQAIAHAGGTPVILPLVDDEKLNRAMYESCDAILFAGGNDVNPALFDEEKHPTVKDVSVLRDTVEMRLMEWSLGDRRPIMGICRGMELLNVIRGGTLYQDIPSMLPDASDHDASTKARSLEDMAHVLRIDPDSRFAQIIGSQTIGTNTHHHQAINRLGQSIKAVGWAEDGVIEVIEDPNHPFTIGVQSHPESMEAKAEPLWRKFFAEFVKQASLG
jgi:putative glutamine amidotransferase